MGLNSRCLWHPPLDLHTTPQALRASSSRPPLRFVEDSLWSPLGTVKNRCGDLLWLVGFGRSGVWSLRGTGSLTPKLGCRAGRWSKNEPKLGCRTGRWCKNDPQMSVSDRSVVKEWAQIWVSDRSMIQKWPPNLMLGVVGRVKRTPKFDARGGRKGKTDPKIWCPGCWIATLRSQWRGAGCWIATLRSQWRGEGTGLLHFARNDGRRGCWIATLRSQSRGAGCWIASLCSQWRVWGRWIATLRSQWREGSVWIASLRSQWRGWGIVSLKRGDERGRDSGFLFF